MRHTAQQETAVKYKGKNRCQYCGLFFMSQAQVDRHIAKRHGPVIQPKCSCGYSPCWNEPFTILIP